MAEHDLQSIAFPTLDEAQIAELSRCLEATATSYRDGETLFAVGERDFKFFIVIKSGEVEIVDHSGDAPKTVTIHRAGRVHRRHLAPDRHSGGRQRGGPGRRARCTRSRATRCRQALNQCPALSDIILQAFIARRQLLRESPDFTGSAGDRVPLLHRTPSASATSWPRTACCSPGWTWRPTRRWTGCSSSSA